VKRLQLLVALAAATLVALPAATVSAARIDSVQGPACANIELLDFAYASVGEVPTVSGFLAVEQGNATCAFATYTVYIYSPDGTMLLGSQTFTGDGTWTEQSFSIEPDPAPNVVCLYAESTIQSHVVDRAPDDGCTTANQLTLGGGSGATSFR
jgi:hypothetical protein